MIVRRMPRIFADYTEGFLGDADTRRLNGVSRRGFYNRTRMKQIGRAEGIPLGDYRGYILTLIAKFLRRRIDIRSQ